MADTNRTTETTTPRWGTRESTAAPDATRTAQPRPGDPERVRGERPGGPGAERAGIAELLKTLSRQSSTLVREEVALARAEMEEKVAVYQRSMASLVVGGALTIGAVLLLVAAVNRGLTALLEGLVSLEVAVWLAPLLLAVVVGGIGYGMITSATSRMREEGVTPQRTVDTLREDKDWAERKVRHG